MIQANELRIGNMFIREIRSHCGLTFDHDFVITENTMGKLFSSDIALALQDLHPIPLTPEILEKCGFYRDRTGFCMDDKMSLSFSIKIDGEFLACWLDKSIEVVVKYLHQLQNLYFALTGTELTVNL